MAVRHHRPARRALTGAVSALALLALSACGGTPSAGRDVMAKSDGSPSATPTPTPAVSITSNVKKDATDVRVNRMVQLDATDGTFRKVLVHSLKGEKVPGALNASQTRWTASSRLEPSKK